MAENKTQKEKENKIYEKQYGSKYWIIRGDGWRN